MRAKSAFTFLAACAVTAGGWMGLWPDRQPPAGELSSLPSETKAKPWPRDGLKGMLTTLETEGRSNEELLRAAQGLDDVPAAEIPSILESIESTRRGELTRPAKFLLIHWASHEPKSAIAWAWEKLRTQPAWQTAFREIAAAWAWRDPEGLAAWTLAQFEAHPPTTSVDHMGELSLEEATSLDSPKLGFGDLTRISGWLLKEDPKLGMEIFLKRGGFSSHDERWEDSLTDVHKIERALQAFPLETIEVLRTRDVTKPYTPGPESHAQTLFRLWKKLDPEGFLNSAYASYLPEHSFETITITAEEWAQMEPRQREKAAQEHLASRSEKETPSSAANIAKEWGSTDPAACREWIGSLSGKTQHRAADEYVRGHAASSLTETLDWIERFGPEHLRGYFVSAFEVWLEANPDAEPDFTGWSDARR